MSQGERANGGAGLPGNRRFHGDRARDAGSGARDLKVDTGAEAAEAFTDGDGDGDGDGDCEVVMRAGAVLIRMQGVGVTDEETPGKFARLRVERVRKTANGQNPDA
ncbi:hypothetical protein RND61_11770 [Streptomyces sp. TRM76323]|uniref:Uncharacterized protein n=1 Tax=Streptomyces tamarix TaxID=3078565 RepID=A0ABU3QJ17_9ACTN|nr:hypothetical protein [Streptomyces tamarix]MDT9682742.1 hypothetical protein [Streptomyces tamarix]